MIKFKLSILFCVLMAPFVGFTDFFAVSATSPAYTHYIYMAGHAGWLHYIINAWTLMVMHNLLRWYRVAAAYLWAVMESYVMLPDRPMVGLSVVNCFFIGFATPWLWRKDRLAVVLTLALLLLTCFVSGFAGLQHVASFIFGFAFCYAEGWIRDIHRWIKD